VLRPTLTFKPGDGWTLQAWGAATIELDFNDVLRTQNNSWAIGYLEGTTANYHSVNDTRNIELSFNYRFGKTIKDQRRHTANGAQSEMNRVGN
jgi:hypothetical protein